MSNWPAFRMLCLTLLAGLCCSCTHGEIPAAKNLTKQDFKALVEKLVSPNHPAETKVGGGPSKVWFPENYDNEAQRKINEARILLHDNLGEALPHLIEALTDERYCMTIDWAEGDGFYNYSVGQICRDVITSNLEVYRDTISFRDSRHWHFYNYPISKEWAKANEGKTLVELQCHAIDWAIQRRQLERPKQPEESQEEVAKLQKLRDGIKETQVPAKPNRMLPMVLKKSEP